MTIKDILLANLLKAVPDSLYQPTDELLDEIWVHIVSEAEDVCVLMGNVIDGDGKVDLLQIKLASTGAIEDAILLRQRLQVLFRNYAYNRAERYESEVMEAYRAAPSCMEGEK